MDIYMYLNKIIKPTGKIINKEDEPIIEHANRKYLGCVYRIYKIRHNNVIL